MSQKISNVAVLSAAEIPSAAAMMATAFSQDPVYRYLLPNPSKYDERLRWMFEFMLRLCLKHGVVHKLGEPVQGVAAWLRPGETIGFGDELKAGAIRAPFVLGLLSAWRSNLLMANAQSNRARLAPGKKYWYLWQFAVAVESRGKGYGRRLLEPVFLDADATDTECWLDNSNAVNLPIYEALGFQAVEEYAILHRHQKIMLWHMRRNPEKKRKQR
jgi:ribosomal protein S18 acetylase RimI-like enzyme